MPEGDKAVQDQNQEASNSTIARPGHQRILFLGLAVLVAAGLFLFQRQGASQSPSPSQQRAAPPSIPIATAMAKMGNLGVYVNALGYVTPVYTVTIRTRVDGQLLNVYYREGQMVRKGYVLAELDSRPFQAQLLQTQGQYDRDKAQLDEAYIDLDRFRAAYARDAIPKQQLDTQQATVHQDEGILKLDQGQIDSARVNLTYCTITSPVTGRVGLRLVDPGNIVHAADTNGLLVVAQIQPITVVFSIAQDDLPRVQQQLRRGHRLQVDALDRAQQTKLGSGGVTALDNLIDATTGTVRLKAWFRNQNAALFPNQFVNTRLLVDTLRAVTLIPTAAIQRNDAATFVYLVNPDETVSIRNITVVGTDGDTSAIQGIEPGDIIAADGFDKLQDGTRVSIGQGPAPMQEEMRQQGPGKKPGAGAATAAGHQSSHTRQGRRVPQSGRADHNQSSGGQGERQ